MEWIAIRYAESGVLFSEQIPPDGEEIENQIYCHDKGAQDVLNLIGKAGGIDYGNKIAVDKVAAVGAFAPELPQVVFQRGERTDPA